MSTSSSPWRRAWAVVGVFSITALPCLAQQSSTAQSLGRAITLYATDSRTNDAEDLLRRVIAARGARTAEGSTARYYLGRLYQRNYYMLGRTDALDKGRDVLKDLHNTIGGGGTISRWYAEARFYKGLIFLEQGKWKDACEAVEHIDKSDDTVEIDYLIWSVDKRVLDAKLPTTLVKQVFRDELTRATGQYDKDCTPSGSWRKDHRDRKAAAAVINALQRSFERSTVKRRS